jgi:hypothetical protein
MISDERYHLYCIEVSKKDSQLLPSNMGQELEQTLVDDDDIVESRTKQKKKIGNEKYENDTPGLSVNRWNDYLISYFSSMIKSIHDNQDELNEQLRNSSVNLSSSYLSTFFEYLKLVNNYWMRIYSNSSNKLLENQLN